MLFSYSTFLYLPVNVEGQVGILVCSSHQHSSLRDVHRDPDQLLVPLLGPVQDGLDGGGGLHLPAVRVDHLTTEILDIKLDSLDQGELEGRREKLALIKS